MDAAERYSVREGVSFTSYASTRVRGAIFDYLRSSDHLSKGKRKEVRDMSTAVSFLTQELGRAPRMKDISNRMNIPVTEVAATLSDDSLMTLSYDSFSTYEELDHIREFQDHTDPLTLLLNRERLQLVHEGVVKHLDKRERFVLLAYYTKDKTMLEIGKNIGVCESRVSHLLKGIIVKLNRFLTEKGVAQCLS